MNKTIGKLKMNVNADFKEVEAKLEKVTEIANEANEALEKLSLTKVKINIDCKLDEVIKDPHEITIDRLVEYVRNFEFNLTTIEELEVLIKISELILKYNEKMTIQ